MKVRTLVVNELPGGLEIPYVDLQGPRDGPHLTILAGIHGTEYTSIAAVREFARRVDPQTLSGRITAVPLVNVPAFWARSPFVVPTDGKNLNRCFPGDPEGSYADVLAHRVFQTFVVGTDYLLDLHAGDLPEALEPFAMYEESAVEATSRDLALAYGLGHVVRQSAAERTVAGSTCAAAADIGVAAIIAESGQNGLLDPAAVDRHLFGVLNVARSLALLPGEVTHRDPPQEHEGWHWLRAPSRGWWSPAVPVGATVGAGELVGTVSDILGDGAREVRAEHDGIVLFVTTSPAVPADGLLLGLARAAG